MEFKKYKKIHFIGIGGIGISALAKLAHLEGVKVSGSDVEESEITRELKKMKIKVEIGHKKENVPFDADLVVYSGAVLAKNPERKILPEKSYFEFLGEITKDKKVIAVSGTNGKSTTTAMLGKILVDAGLDPLVVVGSKIKTFSHGNLNYGKGEYAVIEGCEHNAQMLNLHPWSIVLTNIEKDHLDFYKNLENILKTFKKYIGKVGDGDFLIYNADDKNTRSVVNKKIGISYGAHEDAQIKFENRYIDDGKQFFEVFKGEEKLGDAELGVPGLYNVYNAMAAISMALQLGVLPAQIFKSLKSFKGLWRRFEFVGKYKKTPVISDYGHHPHAVEGVLLGAQEFYPDRRIVLVFEPHQHHRTKALFEDFVRSFDEADVLILSEIYNVSGRVSESDKDISSKKLANAIAEYWKTDENDEERKKHELFFCKNHDEVLSALDKVVKKDDIVIIMGAGDIYKIVNKIC